MVSSELSIKWATSLLDTKTPDKFSDREEPAGACPKRDSLDIATAISIALARFATGQPTRIPDVRMSMIIFPLQIL